MNLYLSSAGIPNGQQLVFMLPSSDLSAVVIPNARDTYPSNKRDDELENLTSRMRQLHITPTVIDLREVTHEKLKNTLLQHPLVWFMGGNTFYLNWLVHESGLTSFLSELVKGGLVYGGESAGAVLAGTTLHGIEAIDDPKEAPNVLWDGLSLVDFGIVPHWKMPKYAEKLEHCEAEMSKYGTAKTITNDQVIIVEDGKVTVLTND